MKNKSKCINSRENISDPRTVKEKTHNQKEYKINVKQKSKLTENTSKITVIAIHIHELNLLWKDKFQIILKINKDQAICCLYFCENTKY